jgi:hypothetical protein
MFCINVKEIPREGLSGRSIRRPAITFRAKQNRELVNRNELPVLIERLNLGSSTAHKRSLQKQARNGT